MPSHCNQAVTYQVWRLPFGLAPTHTQSCHLPPPLPPFGFPSPCTQLSLQRVFMEVLSAEGLKTDPESAGGAVHPHRIHGGAWPDARPSRVATCACARHTHTHTHAPLKVAL